jgi:hypothetical protein
MAELIQQAFDGNEIAAIVTAISPDQFGVRKVVTLRNRISHHEPLIGRDNLSNFSNLMTLMEWICPEKAAWIRPHHLIPTRIL